MISALDWDDAPADIATRWPANVPLLWLHSGRLHSRWARWSIMASPRAVWQFERGRSLWTGDMPPQLATVRFTHDPLADLDAILNATRLDHDALGRSDLPFRGGWIGFFSYDLGRVIEPKAQHHDHVSSSHKAWPLIELAWCPEAVVFDHLHRKWMRVGDRALIERIMHASAAAPLGEEDFHLGEIKPEMAASQYKAMVARTVEYIAAGDIFQANIAQRFLAEFEGSTRAFAITAFASAQPWYGAYLESPAQPVVQASLPARGPGRHGGLPHDHHARRALLSLSPELFLETDPPTRRMVTRPIKGTRPIACDPRELRDSIKDEAELNMIVDLMRNDLGRVCQYGSVRVTQPRLIETHPTVHHGVAEIEGALRAGTTVSDLLRATFPPGSVTGAPKIRAMQIIDELEGASKRGPYCGAIGFISDCGRVTLNVAIRTLLLLGRTEHDRSDLLYNGEASYSAGAGIVADSVPARELQETLDKAAVLRTLISRAREPMQA